METKKLLCDNCGATLTIEGTPNFIDCRFCGTSLRIVRTASSTFTEVHKAVKAISAEVSGLRKESNLRALDERWRNQQEQLSIGYARGGGPGSLPTKGFAFFIGLLGSASGAVILGIGLNIGRDAVMFGVSTAMVIATITLVGVSWILHRSERYEFAKRVYLAERQAIKRGNAKASATSAPQSTSRPSGSKSKARSASKRSPKGRSSN